MTDLDDIRAESIGDTPTRNARAELVALAKSDEAYRDTIVRSVNQNIKLRWIGLAMTIVALLLLVVLEAYLLRHIMWHYGHAEDLTQLAFAPIVAFTAIITVFLFAFIPRLPVFRFMSSGIVWSLASAMIGRALFVISQIAGKPFGRGLNSAHPLSASSSNPNCFEISGRIPHSLVPVSGSEMASRRKSFCLSVSAWNASRFSLWRVNQAENLRQTG